MRLAAHMRVMGTYADIDPSELSNLGLNDPSPDPDAEGVTMMGYDKVISSTGCTTFAAATDFEFSREMYNKMMPKDEFNVKVSLGNVGKQSLTVVVEAWLIGQSMEEQ